MPKKSIRRLFFNLRLRSMLFLYGGTAFHFLYALFRLLTGARYRASHVDATALFYLSLALNRFFLILAYRDGKEPLELHLTLRRSGRLLFFTVGIMLVLIVEIIAGGRRSSYPMYIAVISGGYAAGAALLSFLELFYLRRLHSPLLSTSRAVGLASTLLSFYTFLGDLLFYIPFSEKGRLAFLLLFAALFLFVLLFFAFSLTTRKSDA